MCNSHGGIGRQAWKWLSEAYQTEVDKAPDVASKYTTRLQLQVAVAEIGVAVLRRNSFIMAANASPTAGGDAPPTDEVYGDASRGDVMQE